MSARAKSIDLGMFFVSRALSTFGDEVWQVAIPLYFAIAGFSSRDLGVYSSLCSLGSVLGFFLLPKIATTIKAGPLSIVLDMLQVSVFALISVVILAGWSASVVLFCICGFILSCAAAMWFGSSETLASIIIDKNAAQSFHRLNYLSTTIGPFLAPFAGSALFFAIGLGALAVFNLATFLPQILAISRLGAAQNPQISQKNDYPDYSLEKLTTKAVISHPYYGPLLVVTSAVKVGLLGILPFIPYLGARSNSPILNLGLLIAAFPFGTFIGALSFRQKNSKFLARAFLLDCIGMFLTAAILIVCLKYKFALMTVISAMLSGVFCARYTIEIRAMRQLITPPEHMPQLISIQGLSARLVTPLSGLIFGIIYSEASSVGLSLIAGTTLMIIGIGMATVSAKGFQRLLPHA